MSIQNILRQNQIREMLDYDVIQNKRVFDSQVKQVAAMNEISSAPKKTDIEFEASVRQRVESIILAFQQLTSQLGSVKTPSMPVAPRETGATESREEEEDLDKLLEKIESREGRVTAPARKTALARKTAPARETGATESKEAIEERESKEEEDLDKLLEAIESREGRGKHRLSAIEEDEEGSGMSGGMIQRMYMNRMKGGISGRELELSVSLAKDRMESALSSIYSQFNALVDFINAKFRTAGYSDQQINNIYTMLNPIIDVSKDAMLAVTSIRDTDRSLYNRSYNLLYEIVQNIQNAPPLMRLDVTKIRDEHYVTEDTREYEDFVQDREKYIKLLERYEGDVPATTAVISRIKGRIGIVEEASAVVEEIEKLKNEKNAIIDSVGTSLAALSRPQQTALTKKLNSIDKKISSLETRKAKLEEVDKRLPPLLVAKGKSGGRKAVNENAAVKAQKVSNARARKQQERFNAEAQNPFGPPTYRGLKPDNSLGTLGAGKKNIKMKKTDFVKEHKNLISMLGKTAKKLKSEATEQLQELSAIDKEKAMELNRVVNNEQLKAAGKKKGKKSTKLPVLSFDDKRNDWYL